MEHDFIILGEKMSKEKNGGIIVEGRERPLKCKVLYFSKLSQRNMKTK